MLRYRDQPGTSTQFREKRLLHDGYRGGQIEQRSIPFCWKRRVRNQHRQEGHNQCLHDFRYFGGVSRPWFASSRGIRAYEYVEVAQGYVDVSERFVIRDAKCLYCQTWKALQMRNCCTVSTAKTALLRGLRH